MAGTIWDQNNASGPATSASTQGNQWFDQNNTYRNLPSKPLSVPQSMREGSYPVAFNSYLNGIGMQDNESNASRYAYAQQPKFQRAHQLALQKNPYMTMDQFIATLPGLQGVMNEFNMRGPDASGKQYSRYAPNSRILNR